MQNGIPLVLVAEDDESLRYTLKVQLSRLGIKCHFVQQGREAVEKARSGNYDLILMDVHMPKMDGLEATRAIRKEEGGNNSASFLPIIALTADPKKQQCYNAGMNDFILKPILLEPLQRILARWVSVPAVNL